MSTPKPPSPPKAPKIDRFAGIEQDPRYAQAIKETGFNMNSDNDIANIERYLLKKDFETERNDPNFVTAERQLLEEGLLSGGSLDFKSDKADRFRRKYEGDGNWKDAYFAERSNSNFNYNDRQDLQRVFDRVADNEQAAYNKQYNKSLEEQAAAYTQSQQDAQKAQAEAYRQSMRDMRIQNKKNMKLQARQTKRMTKRAERQADKQLAKTQRFQEKQLKQQQKFARESELRQAEIMEKMLDQPTYSPRQAALPVVQYKAKTPDPMPVAPAPPPQMNISPAPAPELVNMGNQMGIVRQSQTARQRSRRRTRGTSQLT